MLKSHLLAQETYYLVLLKGNYFFIWLCCLFVAARVSLSFRWAGVCSSCDMWVLLVVASPLVEHRCWRIWASLVVACGLSSFGSWAPEHLVVVAHRLSCPEAWGGLPGSGTEPFVSCTGRQILYHWATRKVLLFILKYCIPVLDLMMPIPAVREICIYYLLMLLTLNRQWFTFAGIFDQR